MLQVFAPLALVLGILGLGLVSCSDDCPSCEANNPVPQPPEGAGDFLGYSSNAEQKTVCGNCHVGYQNLWVLSGHAQAWETLQNSGHAQEFCEPCHTVGPNGNPEDTGGHAVVPDQRYHDVQCEACHGPGLDHVENPDQNAMFASIVVDADATCGECHQGTHHPFVEQWKMSKHAISNEGHTAGREECAGCHSAQGFLRRQGVLTGYQEWNDPIGDWQNIVCVTCHDPHHTGNPGNLRLPLNAASKENNLCISCHHKRAQPDIEAETTRGPHSPEGPLVLGEEVGWIPDGVSPPLENLRGSHGSERNERLCATCHVAGATVSDSTGFVFQSVGHLFSAIACSDENGLPIPDGDCDLSERDFSSCANSGCHLDQDAARAAFTVARTRVDNAIEDLQALLDQVDPAELDPKDGVFTIAEGAQFNRQLAELPGSHVHNVFMIEWLLDMSMDQVMAEYGVSAPGIYGEE
jgi:predicted CXXCH cytochrome family protein